ncbi:MAG: hypothetical protein RIT45_3960 [Pseudomonadota bacterium]|jgi:23S rRNA (cytosine1962-C5)-methyltransferase
MSEARAEAEAVGREHGAWLLARVRKNERRLARALREADTDAYRVYDRDIPEVPLTVDRYADHLHIAVWSRGAERDPELRERRIAAAIIGLADGLGVPDAHVHVRERARQRGTAQYERRDRGEPTRLLVREAGLQFEVDLDTYVDSGLFLDHRIARRRVGAAAAGRRMLNLFAYTGAFSVHAALGGASTTTSVDLSTTYCTWAERNLRHNGVRAGDAHAVVAADVLQWLESARRAGARYDLIVCDPPTFSNSKRARATFDVDRDHAGLLRRTLELLAPGGTLLFSTNSRRFELDARVFDGLLWRETSDETVPPDFRDRHIHRSWIAERP